MKIEPGKFYTTRDGRKARIYATDGCNPIPIHGATIWEDQWYIQYWLHDGTRLIGEEDPLDLISEWVEKPVVDWSSMPAWCVAVALDASGTWYGHRKTPHFKGDSWRNNEVDGAYFYIPKDFAPTFTGNWKDSLVSRP